MLFTIGYESASPQDFIATLQAVGVDMVADVRERAQSRRAGFSKNALATALKDAGIAYVHLRELGDPPAGREAARSGNWAKFRAIFSGVIRSPEGQAALSRIEVLTSTQTVCLLCYERNPVECHRKIVADELEARVGIRTRHIGVRTFESTSKCA